MAEVTLKLIFANDNNVEARRKMRRRKMRGRRRRGRRLRKMRFRRRMMRSARKQGMRHELPGGSKRWHCRQCHLTVTLHPPVHLTPIITGVVGNPFLSSL